MDSHQKFAQFRDLHQVGKPVILYNIWDAGSAKTLVDAGAPVVATGSKPLAVSQGYPDGEVIPIDRLLETASQIVNAVEVPVSIDFEGGYAGLDHALLATNISRLLDAGVVGINFEDQQIGKGGLYDVATQAERIQLIRATAEQQGKPLFINARTDLFLQEKDSAKHEALLAEAIARATAYAEAGANGFFAPGLVEPELIRSLCSSSSLPVNIVKLPAAPSNEVLAACGVARISYGPFAYMALMETFAERAAQLFY